MENWINTILIIVIGIIMFILRNSTKSYIDSTFNKKLEEFKSELVKSNIQFQTGFDYHHHITREALKATIEAYGILLDSFGIYWAGMSITPKSGESDNHFSQLKAMQGEISKRGILIKSDIFEMMDSIVSNFMTILLLKRSGPLSENINNKMGEYSKDINAKIIEIPNRIRSEFGLKNIPDHVLTNLVKDKETMEADLFKE